MLNKILKDISKRDLKIKRNMNFRITFFQIFHKLTQQYAQVRRK